MLALVAIIGPPLAITAVVGLGNTKVVIRGIGSECIISWLGTMGRANRVGCGILDKIAETRYIKEQH